MGISTGLRPLLLRLQWATAVAVVVALVPEGQKGQWLRPQEPLGLELQVRVFCLGQGPLGRPLESQACHRAVHLPKGRWVSGGTAMSPVICVADRGKWRVPYATMHHT